MSEPIMVVSENVKEAGTIMTESSSSGPGPPKRIPLTLQRKPIPIDSNPPENPIIFILGRHLTGKISFIIILPFHYLFRLIILFSYDLFLKIKGGPGSGKITHCDRLTRIDDRLFHLNMQATFLEVASEIGMILYNLLISFFIEFSNINSYNPSNQT